MSDPLRMTRPDPRPEPDPAPTWSDRLREWVYDAWIWLLLTLGAPVLMLLIGRDELVELSTSHALSWMVVRLGERQRAFVAARRAEAVEPEDTSDVVRWEEREDGLYLVLVQRARMRPHYLGLVAHRERHERLATLEEVLDASTTFLWLLPAVRTEVRERAGKLIRHKLRHPYVLEP